MTESTIGEQEERIKKTERMERGGNAVISWFLDRSSTAFKCDFTLLTYPLV